VPSSNKNKPGAKRTHPPYLLLANIGQLLTMAGGAVPRRGRALAEIVLIKDAALLCGGGRILAAGPQREMLRDPWLRANQRKVHEFDCEHKVVVPGLIDSHTHPAFIGPRLIDFEKRVSGASYEQIAAAGGGIRSSVAAVREATRKQLTERVLFALNAMLEHGTSVVEAKSGYGLSLDDEMKSLQAIREAARRWPGKVVSTLLAAHVVPVEFAGREEEYVNKVCEEMIPLAAKNRLAQFVDVFCERGAFTLKQSEKILAAARSNGLGARAHVGQFTASPVGDLLRHQPASLDHLDCLADEDISLLAQSNTIATLVPGANYFLGHRQFPDARRLIDAGVAVALATDYNPGSSPTLSMPFVMSLACTQMKLMPEEALSAATINAACALQLQSSKGSIEAGKDADLAIFDIEDYREIAYWFAWNRCDRMVIAGRLVPRT
jgi:imidazolonepropionase